MNVLPDIQLGPIGNGEYPNALALVSGCVVEAPELRALILRVPAMLCGAEGEDSFLGAAFLFVAPRPAECRGEFILVERLFEALGLHHIGMNLRAMSKGADALGDSILIDMHYQV